MSAMDELVDFETYFRDELSAVNYNDRRGGIGEILERYGWNDECQCQYCGGTFDTKEMMFDAENDAAVCCKTCYKKFGSIPPKKRYTVKVVEEYTIEVYAWSAPEAERRAQEEAFTQVPDYTGTEILGHDF